jgi:tRNA pseudouridine38-40 synthase
MQRYLFTIQYRGTRYAGWQSQENAQAIQPIIERGLQKLCNAPVVLHAAGRTDSGVHARGQRAHVDIPIDIAPASLVRALNAELPSDIRVSAAEPVAENFHARFERHSKIYVYQIWNESVYDVFHEETHAHVPAHLDLERMQAAASPLVGKHDFKAFTVASPEVSSTWRTITSIDIRREGSRVILTFGGSGFLRFMIRRIVGSLIEVGKGRLDPAAVARSLEPEFMEARWCAPACGLILEQVIYD